MSFSIIKSAVSFFFQKFSIQDFFDGFFFGEGRGTFPFFLSFLKMIIETCRKKKSGKFDWWLFCFNFFFLEKNGLREFTGNLNRIFFANL